VPDADRVAQPVEELHEGEVEVEDAGDRAAQDAGHVAPERKQRHRQHQREDARQHQPFDRVQPDSAHGVDFLVDLHGADLGGEGAARAAGDDDRGEQHAQFAEHADADGFHREGLGAELAQLLHALVGDHHADQEGQHADDDQCLDPDLEHLSNDGTDAEPARLHAGLEEDDDDLAHEGTQADRLPEKADQVAAELLQPVREPVDMPGLGRHAHAALHDLEQLGMVLFRGRDLGVGAAAGELQDLERARRVEPFDVLGVDQGGCRDAAAACGTAGLVDPRPQPLHAEHGPGAADLEHGRAAALDIAEGGIRL